MTVTARSLEERVADLEGAIEALTNRVLAYNQIRVAEDAMPALTTLDVQQIEAGHRDFVERIRERERGRRQE